jgi:TRAP-type C4-dicarboxylate transport system substrate-binding protein
MLFEQSKFERLLRHNLFQIARFTAQVLTAQSERLRLSHQWANKDVCHKVAKMVAQNVAAVDVDLETQVFGSKSLFKPREQYSPLSRGQFGHDRSAAKLCRWPAARL